MKKLIKILLINFFVFSFVLLSVELVLYFTDESPKEKNPGYYQSFYTWPLAEAKFYKNHWSGAFEPNPIFGITRNRSLPFVNNYGIASLDPYPYIKKNEKEITVGLYGASVAEQLYWVIKDAVLAHPDLEKLRQCGYQIKFLNFAISAGRAPQPMHVYLHTSSWIDALVKLDGNNDITEVNREIPSDFPALTPEFYDMSDEKYEAQKDVYALRKMSIYLITLPLEHLWLQKSLIFYHLHRSINTLLMDSISKKLAFLSKMSTPLFKKSSPNESRLEEMIKTWLRSTEQMHLLSEAENKLNFYFIQPTQYTEPGKPMSSIEYATAITKDANIRKYMTEAFEKLGRSSISLKNAGLKIHNLSKFYTQNVETIFTDDCCHINEAGNKILANEIIRIISPELVKKYSCK